MACALPPVRPLSTAASRMWHAPPPPQIIGAVMDVEFDDVKDVPEILNALMTHVKVPTTSKENDELRKASLIRKLMAEAKDHTPDFHLDCVVPPPERASRRLPPCRARRAGPRGGSLPAPVPCSGGVDGHPHSTQVMVAARGQWRRGAGAPGAFAPPRRIAAAANGK